MRIPPPPGFNPTPVIATDKKPTMHRDETAFILQTTLYPEHSSDPVVMKFIVSYLQCRNVQQAAVEAGIDSRSGRNLRSRPDIHEAIRKITETAVLKHGFDAAEVIERVKEVIDVDMATFQKPDGSWIEHITEIPAEARRAVKKFRVKNEYATDPNGVKIVVGKIMEVEFWDKLKSAELLGGEKEIFKKTVKHEHEIGKDMRHTLLESVQRAEEFQKQLNKDVIEITAKDVSNGNASR